MHAKLIQLSSSPYAAIDIDSPDIAVDIQKVHK